MNGKLVRLLLLAAFSVSSLITINAQQPVSVVSDLYVVSAEAGGINLVSGDVKIRSGSDRQAIKGDKMVAGERMVTGADGRAEVLLNPGSFLRLSQNTEFEFTSTVLDDLRIKVERGTAIVEFYSVNDLTMSISTPGPEFRLMKSGVYRIDVLNGTSKISVWKGIASISGASPRTIGKGNSVTVSGGQYSETKFDRDIMDAFDSWSKLRSSEVAALNARLQRNVMQQSILASNNDDWWQSNRTGFWVYDPFSRNRCFMPFGRRGSPYGHNYSQNVGSYNVPPPVIVNNGGSNNNTGVSTGNPGDQPPPTVTPRPGRRRHRGDGDGDDGREIPRDGNRNAGQDQNGGTNNPQPGTSGPADRRSEEQRVPRNARDDDNRPTPEERRELRREERRNEEIRREERRSEDRSSGGGNSGNSGGSYTPPPSPPPAPPSNPSPPPPPDPPQRDTMPERKGDPPR